MVGRPLRDLEVRPGDVTALEATRDVRAPIWQGIVSGARQMSADRTSPPPRLATLVLRTWERNRPQRLRGVRMAMGAQGRQLVRLVLRRGVIQLGIGLGIGLVIAGLATGPLQAVYDVQARDPLVFGAVVATLALVGIAASLVPAWRVTWVDPVTALNVE